VRADLAAGLVVPSRWPIAVLRTTAGPCRSLSSGQLQALHWPRCLVRRSAAEASLERAANSALYRRARQLSNWRPMRGAVRERGGARDPLLARTTTPRSPLRVADHVSCSIRRASTSLGCRRRDDMAALAWTVTHVPATAVRTAPGGATISRARLRQLRRGHETRIIQGAPIAAY